jgi:hypothetical protein
MQEIPKIRYGITENKDHLLEVEKFDVHEHVRGF